MDPLVPLALLGPAFTPPELPDVVEARVRAAEQRALRTSSYTIVVKLPDGDGDVLIIHGHTGAYDRVSPRVAAYLKALERGNRHKPVHGTWSAEAAEPAAPAPSDATIQRLKKRGYVTELTAEEEANLFAKASAFRHLRAVHQAPSYILIPTYDCNLRCSYCFQDHMRTDAAYGPLLRGLQPAMVDRLIKGMENIERAHGIPAGAAVTRNVTFFGGEPLLAQSRPIVEYAITALRAKGRVNLSAITNATDLDVYADLLGPGKIAHLQITIDGPPAEHDRRRIYADGSGSFARIAANIDMALALGVKLSIRMNIDRTNIDMLPALGAEFVARGWTGHPGFSTYVAPVHATNDHTAPKTTFNSWELNQALAGLKDHHAAVEHIGGPDDSLVTRVRRIFDNRTDPLPSFRSDFCGAHTSMYILDPFGDIYACWERTGDPSIRIGSIDAAGDVFMNSALLAGWRSRNVTSNEVCRGCRYASYCGGGCAVLAEGQHGSIHSNHCDGFAKRFRHSVAKAYTEHISGTAQASSTDRVCDM